MDDLEALGAATDEFVRIVGVVEAAQWALPTPCEEWDVRELVAHVVGGNPFALLALSGRALDDAFAELFSSPVLGDEPRRDAAETGEEQLRAFERTPAGSGRGLVDELVGSTGRDLTWAG